jgi:uncharacterized RmlC-like cupin family protein
MSSGSDIAKPELRVVHESAPFRGKQGHIYRPAISAEAVGSKALHMQLLEIPPGERAHAHKHESHETAIYVLSGISGCTTPSRGPASSSTSPPTYRTCPTIAAKPKPSRP